MARFTGCWLPHGTACQAVNLFWRSTSKWASFLFGNIWGAVDKHHGPSNMANLHLGWFTKKAPHKSPPKSVFPEFHERFWDLWGAFSGWTNPSGKLAQQHLCRCMRHKKVKNVQCQICVQTNCRTKLTFLKDCNSRSWELLCASHIHAVYFIFTTCTNNKNNINLSYIMISYGDSKYLQHISTIKTQYNILWYHMMTHNIYNIYQQ